MYSITNKYQLSLINVTPLQLRYTCDNNKDIVGFWTVGLLRMPKKCEGVAKVDAKEVAKEIARPLSLFNLS